MTYPFHDFFPGGATQDELRAFCQYWLAKSPATTRQERAADRLLKAGAKIVYLWSATGYVGLEEPIDGIRHSFDLHGHKYCIQFWFVEKE